jgi:hypothetical protein
MAPNGKSELAAHQRGKANVNEDQLPWSQSRFYFYLKMTQSRA